MDDRRKLPRKYLVIYSRVFDHDTSKVIGYLSDLSVGGAMIIGESPLEIGKTLTIRIDLPDTSPFSSGHLDLPATVAWCEPDVTPSFHNSGLSFVKVSNKEAEIINRMVDAFEFRREAGKYPPSINSLEDNIT